MMSTRDKLAPAERDTAPRTKVETAIRAARRQSGDKPWLLAVSGGIDSMVLLHAAAKCKAVVRFPLHVATFDHGTGPVATASAMLVMSTARALGIPCTRTKASSPGRTEAEWRRARWAFLRSLAHDLDAAVVTAHTETDQIETVFMRILRNAGPRGIAALYAKSEIVRPFLYISRQDVSAYAAANAITYIPDPSNINNVYLRNRVRNDILPRIRVVDPGFESALLDIAQRSADWRAHIDQIAANFTVMRDARDSVHIPRAQFLGYPEASLRVLWPALLAQVGIVMDWRGTQRLAAFTIEGDSGQSIQLSGGVDVRLRRNAFVFTRSLDRTDRSVSDREAMRGI